MLKNIPNIISPELLKVLNEMGHGSEICIGDGNFPAAAYAVVILQWDLKGLEGCRALQVADEKESTR